MIESRIDGDSRLRAGSTGRLAARARRLASARAAAPAPGRPGAPPAAPAPGRPGAPPAAPAPGLPGASPAWAPGPARAAASRRAAATRPPDGALAAEIRFELREGLASPEVEHRLLRARRTEDVGARVVSFYLADLHDRGLHQDLGFGSAERFADARLGLAPSTTRERIATGRALEELPAIDRAFQEGRLSWSSVRELARVATGETEAAWAAWGEGRTAREVAAHVRARHKGDLPADPARRSIHTTRIAVRARLDVVQWELWSRARAKLEAETGGPIRDAELMVEAARVILATRPDGTVPGRRPVADGHYKVHVDHCPGCGSTRLRTEDGAVDLDPAQAAVALDEAGRGDLTGRLEARRSVAGPPAAEPPARGEREAPGDAKPGLVPGEPASPEDARASDPGVARASDPGVARASAPCVARASDPAAGRDDGGRRGGELAGDARDDVGSPVPPEQRDVPTPDRLRRAVLARDGGRCVCCASIGNLTVHHRVWREHGGRSEASNLLTLCEDCHSLVHARRLVVRGRAPNRLRFLDRRGREIARGAGG